MIGVLEVYVFFQTVIFPLKVKLHSGTEGCVCVCLCLAGAVHGEKKERNQRSEQHQSPYFFLRWFLIKICKNLIKYSK